MTQASSPIEHAGNEHLDDLLDRALSGKLSETELARLKGHTAECAACAALLELGPVLSDRLRQGPTHPASDERVVLRALAGASEPLHARRARLAMALTSAAVLVGSLAAARYSGVLSRPQPPPSQFSPAVPRAPAAKAAVAVAPVDSAAARPEQSEAARSDGKPSSVLSAAGALETPSALFALANQQRRSSQDALAIATYRKLQQAYPHSEQAALSHATLGALLLQRGDPKAALAELERYIARGGPVLEDALASRARALAQLGDRSGEARAWQELLGRFPASVHAARARARLAELR